MKNSTKKILAVVSAVAMLSASTVALAEYDPNKVVDPNVASTKMVKPVYAITLNGEKLEDANVYISDERVMIPLRTVCENLDYEITWNEEAQRIEVTRLPHYITFTAGVDGYTFARTAPLMLGKASELIDGTTYVPIEFVKDILQMDYKVEQNGAIIINDLAEEEISQENKVIITEINEKTITVKDVKLGEVVLKISDETEILNEKDEKIKFSDLAKDMDIIVEYSPIMTASLPPQNSPLSIKIASKEIAPEVEEFVKEGIIRAVDKDSITIGGENPQDQTVLLISDETSILDEDGKKIKIDKLEKGMFVTAKHSPMATMSIPPQTPALEIIISDEDKDDKDDKEEVEEVEAIGIIRNIEEGKVTIGGEKPQDQTTLIITEETEIEDKNGKDITVKDLKVGNEIKVSHSVMSTRSIPPQTVAFEIEIIK